MPFMTTALQDLTSDEQHIRGAVARLGEFVGGRWHLDSLIGVGGMASVYAATHRNGNRVAIKMLHPELSTDGGVRQRFIDEGYVANRVKHAGIVSVFDDGETADGLAFLVMDLLQGQTLEERLRDRKTLPPREVLAIAAGLLDALAAAHDEGIVHRDIKPANIFITRDGTVRLLDFGIASSLLPGHPHATQSGTTMGTPSFMSPEQARGHWAQVDGRTDLWAVGATMFTALTGRPVHAANTTNEELLAAMTRSAPSLRAIVPGAPKRLVRLVDRALAFKQSERWSSARIMQSALRAIQAEVEVVGVVGKSVWLPRASLIPRAMWIARTRSWYVLPPGGVSEIRSLLAKQGRDRRRSDLG